MPSHEAREQLYEIMQTTGEELRPIMADLKGDLALINETLESANNIDATVALALQMVGRAYVIASTAVSLAMATARTVVEDVDS